MQNQNLLNSIGLCFSGGGYRAAAFSLGVLSYLNKLKYNNSSLLEKVEAISTVSGGTITGAYYAYSKYQRIEFEIFYKKIYTFLANDKLLENALEKLQDDDFWDTSHKKRSLINAFALAYDELLETGTFEDLEPTATISLKNVCFNATEFAYGLTFRFQNCGIFGNNPLQSADLNILKGKTELSDAIASSSCFPFGFEPMILPDDYFKDHDHIDYKNLKEKEIYRNGIGIMDGGIVDNQGIGSIINIDRRRKNPLGAFIICDVGSYKMDQWLQSDFINKNRKRNKSINHLISKTLRILKFKWYHWVIPLFGIILLGTNSMKLIGGYPWPFLYVIGGILLGAGSLLFLFGLITTLLRAGLILFVKNSYHKNIPDELVDDVATLRSLDISTVKRMISERLSSAMVMISEVFLNQIRRLNYRLLLEKDVYKKKSISLRVYQLIGRGETLGERFRQNPDIDEPSKKINQSALIASQMPTTLWWDQEDRNLNRLDNLIACGQFTTCYNLLDYLIKDTDNSQDDQIKNLKNQLKDDWEKFLKSPLYLL